MELIFVRHGEPDWTRTGVDRTKAPLTDRGDAQAARVAQRIANEYSPLSEIIASTALRAQESARPIADLARLPVESFDGLVELGLPSWNGLTKTMVLDTFERSFNRPETEWWSGVAGGESFLSFHERVTVTMLKILDDRGVQPHPKHDHLWSVEKPDQRIAIVSHGGTAAVAMALLLGLPPVPWEWKRFRPAHASISVLAAFPFAESHVWSLKTFNDQEHLPEDIRTRARYLP